ncbi:MAG: hypothetical protein ACREHG_00760 [Candidatus Saccharimonadales bacterium]
MSTPTVTECQAIAWHYAQQEQQQGLTGKQQVARCINPSVMRKDGLEYHIKHVLESPIVSKEQLKSMLDKWKGDKRTAAAFIQQRLATLDHPPSRRGSRSEGQQLDRQEDEEGEQEKVNSNTGTRPSSAAEMQQLIRAAIQQQIREAMLGSVTDQHHRTRGSRV